MTLNIATKESKALVAVVHYERNEESFLRYESKTGLDNGSKRTIPCFLEMKTIDRSIDRCRVCLESGRRLAFTSFAHANVVFSRNCVMRTCAVA